MLITYALVVLSAMMHAYWNFLLKRRGGGTVFVGLSKVAETVVFAPAFIAVLAIRGVPDGTDWPQAGGLIAIAAMLTLLNYVALAQAYRHGELSFVYPVARGGALLFLPPLGFLVFGERLDLVGWVALGLILLGLATLQLADLRRRAKMPRVPAPAVLFALLAGFTTACYTIWDKRAIGMLPAFVYFYSYSAILAAIYGAFLLRRHARATLVAEWRTHRTAIVLVGVLNSAAYLLVLVALEDGTSSYVIAIRQLSIVFGVGLGCWLLGERLDARQRLGLALLVAGCCLVALAR